MLQRDDHDWRLTMLDAIREVQIPLLAAMLLGGCGAKAFRVLRAREITAAFGPTALMPLRLRRPIAIGVCAAEFAFGVALGVTAGWRGAGLPAALARVGTALLFLTAVGALVELRERRPGAGCGCFGDLSVTPVGARAIGRAALLSAAAIATIGLPPLHMPASGSAAGLRIGLFAAELALIAALSPEIGEAMIRLGYSEPCEIRRISVERTLDALAGAAPWRQYAGLITSAAPADIWREGCWRYVLYTGETGDRSVEIVFAVYLRARRPQIRAAVLDAATDEVLTALPAHPGGAAEPRHLRRLVTEPGPCGDIAGPDVTRLHVPPADVPLTLDVGLSGTAGRPHADLAAHAQEAGAGVLARHARHRSSVTF
jgi:hypothetical protein